MVRRNEPLVAPRTHLIENLRSEARMFLSVSRRHGTRRRSTFAKHPSGDRLPRVENACRWAFPVRASAYGFLAIHCRSGDHARNFSRHHLQRALKVCPVRTECRTYLAPCPTFRSQRDELSSVYGIAEKTVQHAR